jgi:hypothetical protein
LNGVEEAELCSLIRKVLISIFQLRLRFLKKLWYSGTLVLWYSGTLVWVYSDDTLAYSCLASSDDEEKSLIPLKPDEAVAYGAAVQAAILQAPML